MGRFAATKSSEYRIIEDMQNSKIIDITRSYIPVDPNRFPETLHGTKSEDFPEDRVPVVPYMGQNFLPTARGYKSFFGTGSHLNFTNLPTYFIDDIFIFQTETFLNILVALTPNGIFYKVGSTTGAWIQIVVLISPDESTFYEWSKVVIKNKLYLYRSNGAVYYVIETDEDATYGVSLTTTTPQFNGADYDITGMLGMGRMGARLCFWDGANSIAYSQSDVVSNFTPDVLGGANITKFNTVIGKICDIKMHGKDAIIYASKSVNYLTIDPSQTFFAKATPLLQAGVPYKRMIATANPDTTHFCVTDCGLYKIENGKPEEIVTEFWDYLKQYTAQPVFLKILSGRFLFFETLDENTLNGNAIFSTGVVPPATIAFAGNENLSLTTVHASTAEGICDYITGIDNGSFTDQQADATAAGVPVSGNRLPGTFVTPVYTCYLSLANGPTLPITWTSSPCGYSKITGGLFTPSPTGNGGKLSEWTVTSSKKTAKTGAEVWTDGKWTMQRFVQYQSAIWKIQEDALREFLSQIAARVESASLSSTNVLSCTPASSSPTCVIGRYPDDYSDYKFGWNKCSFWLTRWALSAKDATNNYTSVTTCDGVADVLLPPYGYQVYVLGSPWSPGVYSDAAGCLAAVVATYPASGYHLVDRANGTVLNITGEDTTGGTGGTQYLISPTDASQVYDIKSLFTASAGKHIHQFQSGIVGTRPLIVHESYITGHYDSTVAQGSNNTLNTVPDFAPIPETAYCVITAWEWYDTAGIKHTTAAAACTDVTDKYPGVFSALGYRGVGVTDPRETELTDNGNFCGQDLAFPGLIDQTGIYWPDTSLDYPFTTFLLQDGSIGPRHPVIPGAFVYDLSLKKWGKMVTPYMQLLDYSPLNSVSTSPIDFSVFGIMGGCVKTDGHVYIFDHAPTLSEITYGKYGFYRAGITDLEEVIFNFARAFTGSIRIDGSLDGSSLGVELTETFAFNSVLQAVAAPSFTAKWYNFTIIGNYELAGIEPKGLIRGRR